MIEASWGLGEAVVAGLVIPDSFRVDRAGQVLERAPGSRRIAIRALPDGGTFEEEVAAELVEQLCLDDDQLAALNELARRCEEVYGPDRDIEWAFADGTLYLLQCRAVTSGRAGAADGRSARPTRCGACRSSPTSTTTSSAQVALLFKERRFAAGETVIKEGAGGAAFFVIESGEATVTIARRPSGRASGRATTSARSR